MGTMAGMPGSPIPTPQEIADQLEAARAEVMETALTDRSSPLYANWKAVLYDGDIAIANNWLNKNCKLPWITERVTNIRLVKGVPKYRIVFRSPKDATLFRMFFG